MLCAYCGKETSGKRWCPKCHKYQSIVLRGISQSRECEALFLAGEKTRADVDESLLITMGDSEKRVKKKLTQILIDRCLGKNED